MSSVDQVVASDTRDRMLHALQARMTGSLSPASLYLAYLDWLLHLANAPMRRAELARAAVAAMARLALPDQWLAPEPADRRFRNEAWSQPPFNFLEQSFLLWENWWGKATAPLPGVTHGHADIVAFVARQMLDMVSPTNFVATNPQVLQAAFREGGMNFVRGAGNWLEDFSQLARGHALQREEGFRPGKEVAVTPGKVIFRNDLMELIQYTPTTPQVRPEPILIVPAWIMKYYILDLSPSNSFVRFLLDQGFQVFCISWVNPDASLRNTGFDDYRRLGVMAALDVISDICVGARVHACGYCLGGTLLAVAAAAMARDRDDRLATVSLLAAQTDFTEAGELQLFTDESQLALLDDMMWWQGYLDSSQMAGAFEMLRSNELIWSRNIETYLLGKREHANDLMAWNADATRMPYRMHSEYLHSMFLDNDLAEGRFLVDGRPVAVSEIARPIFAVGTETDHVAPWRSVFKIHLLNQGEITFVLTKGGHNAGVVSEPGHAGRAFRIATRKPGDAYAAPDVWRDTAAVQQGSWWPGFTHWLEERS
ncbi:MAG TPA: alpha/beta fold hydrolase, partial [Rhizomicrobium sp.]|nr:alpha/beta fold hydrolase [Rhizomicrobium sp.]